MNYAEGKEKKTDPQNKILRRALKVFMRFWNSVAECCNLGTNDVANCNVAVVVVVVLLLLVLPGYRTTIVLKFSTTVPVHCSWQYNL